MGFGSAAIGGGSSPTIADGTISEDSLSPDVQNRLSQIENRLAVNTLRDQVNAGWTVLGMIEGFSDEYEDETGISSNTGTYNATTDAYQNVPPDYGVLLSMDDTGLTDDTGNHVVTLNGDAARDATYSKFGGYSAAFDGTGDYLSIPNAASLQFADQDFTVDAWVRPTSSFPGESVVVGYGSLGNGWTVNLVGDKLSIQYTSSGAGAKAIIATSALSLDSWQHIAVTRASGVIRLFIDGVEDATTFTDATTFNTPTTSFGIGARISAPDRYFIGNIDEVRVLKGEASWTTGFTPPTSAYSLDPADFEIVSNSFTAASQADNSRLVILHEPVDSVTINTDVKAYASRDGGTTWTEATLTEADDFDSSIDILTTGDVDVSGQPAGTSMAYKIETINTKEQKLHGTWMQWR